MKKVYQQSAEELEHRYRTSHLGLSAEEAGKRREQYGPNQWLKGSEPSVFMILFSQLKNPITLLLFLVIIICMKTSFFISGSIILGVVLLNTVLQLIQALRSYDSLSRFSDLSTSHAKVIRDGSKQTILSTELTIGDILILEKGDIVNADVRLIEAYSLQVDESLLTGVDFPVDKVTDRIEENECPLKNQHNMIFSSSYVIQGYGTGMVVNIGIETEIGRMHQILSKAHTRKRPLECQLDALSQNLSVFILGMSLVIYILNALQEEVITSFSLLVLSITPILLPTLIFFLLQQGKQRLITEGVHIQNLYDVDRLGRVSVALIESRMLMKQTPVIKHVYVYQSSQEVENVLLLANALCCEDDSESYPKVNQLAFDLKRKIMSTLHAINDEYVMFVKGGSDEVIKRCSHLLTSEGTLELTDSYLEDIQQKNHEFQTRGLSVLGLAMKKRENSELAVKNEYHLTFLGFIALEHPLYEESQEAILDCLSLGIKPILLTNDQKLSAKGLAQQLGIYQPSDLILEGSELDLISDDELQEKIEQVTVYVRLLERQKLRVVKAWQALNHKVLITGENAILALQQADIAVTKKAIEFELLKEATIMTVKEENFSTLIKAIKIGQAVKSNLEKMLEYLLVSSLSTFICLLVPTLLRLPLPFSITQLLFLHLVIDPLTIIMISSKPAIRHSNHKNNLVRIIGKVALISIFIMIAYFIGLQESSELAFMLTFATLCAARIGISLNLILRCPLK